MSWFLVLLTFYSLAVRGAPPAFDTLSILRFNTVCAHCHEGECSGRLSFSLGPEAAFSHIRRFAGDVDGTFVRQLQALLEHMKQECEYAPMPALDVQGPLQREILDAYQDPATGNYFMPLGKLEPGTYRLTLHLEAPVSLRVEVLNRWFEFLVDECYGCNRTVFTAMLEVDEASNHYLRLRSPTALRLEALRLSRETGGSVSEPDHDADRTGG